MAQRTCSIEGCGRPYEARGWCGKHYRRWWKGGDPETRRKLEYPDSVLQRIGEPDADGCRPWLGYVRSDGYGDTTIKGKKVLAHRAVYELMVGTVPKGLELDHVCGNTWCVNTDHLEPVDHSTNVRRGDGGKNMAEKTHCPQGHPYDEENTYRRPGYNSRACRTCSRDAAREYQRRKRRMEKG